MEAGRDHQRPVNWDPWSPQKPAGSEPASRPGGAPVSGWGAMRCMNLWAARWFTSRSRPSSRMPADISDSKHSVSSSSSTSSSRCIQLTPRQPSQTLQQAQMHRCIQSALLQASQRQRQPQMHTINTPAGMPKPAQAATKTNPSQTPALYTTHLAAPPCHASA